MLHAWKKKEKGVLSLLRLGGGASVLSLLLLSHHRIRVFLSPKAGLWKCLLMAFCGLYYSMWLLKAAWSKEEKGWERNQLWRWLKPRGMGWGGTWEGGFKSKGTFVHLGWFMLIFDRKWQNSVKKLTFKKTHKDYVSIHFSLHPCFPFLPWRVCMSVCVFL